VACTCGIKNKYIILNRNGDGNVIRRKIIFKWICDARSVHYPYIYIYIYNNLPPNAHKYIELGDTNKLADIHNCVYKLILIHFCSFVGTINVYIYIYI